MKKTLSVLAILGIVGALGIQEVSAFSWSNLNPAYWGHCPRCEKKKNNCECKKKCDPCKNVDKDCPCPTGYAAPCDPCEKKKASPCDPCDRIQREMAK